jgi:hypothetical protein
VRRLLFVTLGLVLLSAAGLKAWDLGNGESPGGGWWTDPRVRLLVVEWEIVLGLWLISGYRPVVGWLVAVVTFAGFAGISGFLGLWGVPSCGCFGATKTSPWWSFAVDVVALAALFRWRPDRAGFGGRVRAELGGARPLVAAAGVVAVVGLIAFTRVSDVADRFVARVRGDTLTARQPVVDVGAGSPGEVREGTAEVSNWSDHPVKVFGGTTGCNYDILADCPRTIPAGSTVTFRVKYRLAEAAGRSTQRVSLWAVYETDHAVAIPLVLAGETVVESR